MKTKMKNSVGSSFLAVMLVLALAVPVFAQAADTTTPQEDDSRSTIFLPLVAATSAQGEVQVDVTDDFVPAEALLSEEELIQQLAPQVEAAAVVAANGKIAFSSDVDGDSDIYTMNPDGSGLFNVTSALPALHQTDPNWSPDGTKILFANDDGHLWVINADGSNASQLTFTGPEGYALNHQPDWSPDGTQIVFTTVREGDQDIYVMNADGSNQHNLFVGGEPFVNFEPYPPYPGDEYDASWSPDGSKILYTASRIMGTDIATVNVANASAETEVLLTAAGGGINYTEAEWSPNGQLIAYVLYYVGPEMFVMNADGTNQTQVTAENLNNLYSPEFSPDGTLLTFIAYQNEVGSSSDLYSIPAPTAPLPVPATVQAAATTATATRLTTMGGVNSADWQKKLVTTVPLYVTNLGLLGGSGVITSQPSGINCGTQCKIEVSPSSRVTLTATPNTGSKFLLWAGACKGKATTCTVAVNKLRLAVAFFAKATHKK
jgi:Tol biopolymer transport system component